MKIGILTRSLETGDGVKVNAVPFTYLNIFKDRYYPVLIDSSLDLNKHKDVLLNVFKDIDGFILPGGSEISDVDIFVIDYCYKNDIPLLGICLGMQEIGYYFNKKCVKPLSDLAHFNKEDKYCHLMELDKKGYLYSLLNEDSISVNSRHKYFITSNRHYVAEGCCDKIIEAIKVKNKKYIMGVQFHPEIMYSYDNNARIIFEDFFNKCKDN